MGILNNECTVVPPCIKVAAIPNDATAIATLPSARYLANIVLYRKVFPQPKLI